MTQAGGEPSQRLARSLVDVAGTQVRAVLLYGSHMVGSAPDRYSAHDLVVVVEQYVGTYRELRRRGFTHRPPRLMASLAWLGENKASTIELEGFSMQAQRHKPDD